MGELREGAVEAEPECLTESPSEFGETFPPRRWSHPTTLLRLGTHSEVSEAVSKLQVYFIRHPRLTVTLGYYVSLLVSLGIRL